MRTYSLVVVLGLLLISLVGLQLLALSTTASTIKADVCIVPEVFNLKQRGVITAYVSNLREDGVSYDVRNINASTIELYYEGYLVAKRLRATVEDGVLVAKFDASTVANYIWTNVAYHMGTIRPQANFIMPLTVSGRLNSGEPFAGSDTIKIILP